MPADILTTDGMFTVRMAAWHGLGHVFSDYPTREQAQAIAHPWEPKQEPIYRAFSRTDENGVTHTEYREVPGFQANVRDDNLDTLGVVSDGYVPVLNSELWDIAEAIEKSGNDVMFETGGSLGGGKQVWALVRLDEPITVRGDPRGETIPYYALQNSHDGTGSFRGQAITTRIVCANTARVADMEARNRGTEFMFRHSKNIGERIEQAREALATWRESLAEWHQQQETLIAQRLEPLQAGEFLERFIPMPPENIVSKIVRGNVERDRRLWLESYNGVTGEGLKNTSYGLVQASIEFLNWHRKANTNESRFKRTFLTQDKMITRAVTLANQAFAESNYVAAVSA